VKAFDKIDINYEMRDNGCLRSAHRVCHDASFASAARARLAEILSTGVMRIAIKGTGRK
jgi:hypothetical protein